MSKKQPATSALSKEKVSKSGTPAITNTKAVKVVKEKIEPIKVKSETKKVVKPVTKEKAPAPAKKAISKTVAPVKKKIKVEANKDLIYRMQDSVSKVMS